MNRLAVVLAADSAATVTQYTGGKEEERYFKGSNKIFQLSDHHPVGLMIFDSADILRVPWEIVVKTFRADLGKKSFNTVKEYAAEFFAFLEKSSLLFPVAIQDEVFLDVARSATLPHVIRDKYPAADADRLAENLQIIEARQAELVAMADSPALPAGHPQVILAKLTKPLAEQIDQWRSAFGQGYPADLTVLATVGILEILKQPERHLATTGLVFAGFGDHEIFPALAAYNSCGVICDKHLVTTTDDFAVTHKVPAKLSSFAQTAMSDTFSLGVSEDVYSSIMRTLEDKLQGFAKDIIVQSVGDASKIADFNDVVSKARREMGKAILEQAQKDHALPLRKVLGVLPVDEMAELAETLINLQALKEKVTKSTETVGGPVDVAIITKSEGLVWVKRKHFFDIGLNSRYLVRQHNRLS